MKVRSVTQSLSWVEEQDDPEPNRRLIGGAICVWAEQPG
jgi:hypothetical protein